MAKRVLFIGAESSGKTTICQVLNRMFDFPWIPEYGRELFEKKEGKLVFEDYLEIARVQVLKEKIVQVCTRERWILCDTSPLVTMFYSQELCGKVDPNLVALSKRQYDRIFFCVRDFGYVDDGTRSGVEFGDRQEEFYMKNLNQPYEFLHGSIEARVAQIQGSML